jgi:hypothetical protein
LLRCSLRNTGEGGDGRRGGGGAAQLPTTGRVCVCVHAPVVMN